MPVETTLRALIDEEHALTLTAHKRFGSFVQIAERAIILLNTFVVSIEQNHALAAAVSMALQKSATLAFLSLVRQHVNQAQFNCRQVVEFCALASYFLAHPDAGFRRSADGGAEYHASPDLLRKANRWLDNELPQESAALREMKLIINETASHASVYGASHTFNWENEQADEFEGSFFDKDDPLTTQLHLMQYAHLVALCVRTLRICASRHGGFKLHPAAISDEATLVAAVETHRLEWAKIAGYPLRPA